MSGNPRVFSDVGSAIRAIGRDMRARERRIQGAVKKTARQTRNYVYRETIPRAFGELADSLHVLDAANGSAVIADAPHAAAVENGSRPHTPPLEPLIRWVMLRGMQGLSRGGRVRAHTWSADRQDENTKRSARGVAVSLKAALKSRSAAASWRATSLAVSRGLASYPGGADPATVRVARAIQQKIARNGTRPHKYMLTAVPKAESFLRGFVEDALPDR